MRLSGSSLRLAASDLANYLACRHRSALDHGVARGEREAPAYRDPALVALEQRGLEHEMRYVESLRASGLEVVDLSGRSDAAAATREAMRRGVAVLVQPVLEADGWFGRPDILHRVEAPSDLGPYSYEVHDTKLSRETRAGTVLQLALYSDLLGALQGREPAFFHVVSPSPTSPKTVYRVKDYAAYYRLVRSWLLLAVKEEPARLLAQIYPEPVEHCDVCRWFPACDERRRADDHLSLVAGISRRQTKELASAGVTTLAGLARMPLPFAPRRGASEGYTRVREQARVQLAGRTTRANVHEILPVSPTHGLLRLPAPSPGDVFLDLEGDPFVREGGREYLFGLAVLGDDGKVTYEGHWATTDREEHDAFDAAMRTILASWANNPGMHVYHYAAYEPSAFKRLMGRHLIHEASVDRMLRAGIFVDLYAVVSHAVRASVERYSIKDLEPFYGFARDVALRDARENLRIVEKAIELGTPIPDGAGAAVLGYNRDDCVSAWKLRDWLEELRAGVEGRGTPLPRPPTSGGEAPDEVSEKDRATAALAEALAGDVPAEPVDRTPDEHARWLLAHLIAWHRREQRAVWWEFYRLRDLADHELLDEPAALSCLRFLERLHRTKRGVATDRYTFPPQELDIRAKAELHLRDERGTKFGEVVAIDRDARTVDVKKAMKQKDHHPLAVFAHSQFDTGVLEDALARLAEDVRDRGLQAAGDHLAARDLLLRRAPRLTAGSCAAMDGEDESAFAVRAALALDRSVLPIQGPPGAGKTYTGARMIVELVRAGKRVGVTAVSHKVIHQLLLEVERQGKERGVDVTSVERVNDPSGAAVPGLLEVTTNPEVHEHLRDGTAEVAGATPWLWAASDAASLVDVLFVDEAGQIALANVLAVAQAAGSLVLLGDPQQLEQPQKGSHPDGTAVSVLEHVLGRDKTMPADCGIFLAHTYRLAPALCTFTSEVFYEQRLEARAGTERQVLAGTRGFDGAGLRFVPVVHEGNRNASEEEAREVVRITEALLTSGASWVHRDGGRRPLTPGDILLVAPYNAHVALLQERLPSLRVGTVDKFQGQEAPVVIYAMAASSPEDAPRGMEFLYSANRLNVATSRARCLSILVASPMLVVPECRTVRQMSLANGLCRYVELAR